MMKETRRSVRTRYLGWLVCSSLLGGCQGGITIDVRLINRPPSVSSVLVTAELDRKPASSGGQSLVQSPERFRVHLEDSLSGQLKLRVSAQDLGGCETAAGENTVDLHGAGSYEVEIAMAASAGCTIELQLVGPGTGKVQFSPSGATCDTACSQQLVRDQQVTLTAQTMDLFGGWFADSTNALCIGRSGCVIKVGSGVTRVRANFIPPQSCLPNGWCSEEGVPAVDRLYGLWGSDRDDVWAVGNSGTLLHGDGLLWTTTASVTSLALRGVWGSSRDDVWAVGESGTLLHYDGTSWKLQPRPTANWLLAVWGSSRRDVWAVGDLGTLLHFDGGAWSTVPSGTTRSLRSVWGSGPADAWAVGDAGTVLHWDGVAFSPFVLGNQSASLHAVWGTAGNNIWMAGEGGTILHLSGLPLSPARADSKTTAELHSLFGVSPTQIWAAGANGTLVQWNGVGWSLVPNKFPASAAISSIWGSGPQDVWAVGLSPSIVRYRP